VSFGEEWGKKKENKDRTFGITLIAIILIILLS